MHLVLNLASAPPIAVAVLLAATVVSPSDIRNGIAGRETSDGGGIVPYSVLVLIFSLAILCISIDEAGLFKIVALTVVRRSSIDGNADARWLFASFFFLSAALTIVASNDVVVLTVTPILLHFAQTASVDAVPFLMASFCVCNVASMALYVGNPTNVIVAQATGINVLEYTKVMGLPTVVSIVVAFIALCVVFWKRVPKIIAVIPTVAESDAIIPDLFGAWFGSLMLITTLVLLMVFPLFMDVSVWIIALPFAGVTLLKEIAFDIFKRQPSNNASTIELSILNSNEQSEFMPQQFTLGKEDGIHTRHIQDQIGSTAILPADSSTEVQRQSTRATDATNLLARRLPRTTTILIRLPWGLIPFTLGMFIFVETLTSLNWTALLATGLAAVSTSAVTTIFSIAVISALACNVLNNLPMSILFAEAINHERYLDGVLQHLDGNTEAAESLRHAALYGLVIGSNIGANILFVGSLAGLMWNEILRRNSVKGVTQLRFFGWCACITPFVLAGACICLFAEMQGGFFH
ncbi:hypothetical protein HDU83_008042 [Entophlyctis luteolus]|nr:hypothetical protein HDU83_008042 [Entophlyctis luteolus]KAJ3394466.1 hypothetical protein HDU84_008462 [Entophlyctis sp. JEL0112]